MSHSVSQVEVTMDHGQVEEPVDVEKHAVIPREQIDTVGEIKVANPRMICRNVDVFYSGSQAIFNVSLDIGKNEVVSMIGPSGCGKSTFLRCLNRMNDTIDGCRVTGTIKLDNQDIYDKAMDVVPLRAQVGMVFQKPNPFPKSLYENVAYGPRIHGIADNKEHLDHIVETSMKKGGTLGRGKRQDGPTRHGSLRRATAATLHCAGNRCGAGGDSDG